MIIKMETESVQLMASNLRKTADELETRMAAIKTALDATSWESQAQVEFMEYFASLKQVNDQSIQALRTMSQAVDKKVDQWEAISRVFNGPFYFIENLWDEVVGAVSTAWNWLWNGISNITLPSIPSIIIPPLLLPPIIGAIRGEWPSWDFTTPDWWPFSPKDETSGGSGDGEIGDDGAVDSAPPVTAPEPQVERDYPYPPESRKVVGRSEHNESCAMYAQNRRPDLGSTQSNNEKWADGAAANYIGKYEDTAFQYDGSKTNLQNVVAEGYAVVWEPDHPYANDTYGHVGIIEQVSGDHVVISHSTTDKNGVYHQATKTMTIDELKDQNIWLIP